MYTYVIILRTHSHTRIKLKSMCMYIYIYIQRFAIQQIQHRDRIIDHGYCMYNALLFSIVLFFLLIDYEIICYVPSFCPSGAGDRDSLGTSVREFCPDLIPTRTPYCQSLLVNIIRHYQSPQDIYMYI